jgi:CheY-like chemotaxis protein
MAIKILLADDSLTIQKVVELTFSDAETRLMAVGSGDRAVQALDEFQPDIVLADVVMPGLTGYEVCEAVKVRPGGAFVPVVLLTGTFEPFDRARAERVGSDAIVTKPFDSHALQGLVRELVERAGVAREEAAVAATAPPPPGIPEAAPTMVLSVEELEEAFPPPAAPAGDTAATQILTPLELEEAAPPPFGEAAASAPEGESIYRTVAMKIPTAEEMTLAAENEGLVVPPLQDPEDDVEPPTPFEPELAVETEPPPPPAFYEPEPAYEPPPPPPPPAFFEPELAVETEPPPPPAFYEPEPAYEPPPPPPPPAFYEPEPAYEPPPPPPAFYEPEPALATEAPEAEEPFFASVASESAESSVPSAEAPFGTAPEEAAPAVEEFRVEVEVEDESLPPAAVEAVPVEEPAFDLPVEESVAAVEDQGVEPFPEMAEAAPLAESEPVPWDEEPAVEIPPPPPELSGVPTDVEDAEPITRDIEADLEAFEASGRVRRRPEIWERHAALIGEEVPDDIDVPGAPPAPEPAPVESAEPFPSELEEIAAAARLEDLSALIPSSSQAVRASEAAAEAARDAEAPAVEAAPFVLSEADVDRIARRVVELLSDKAVRDIAWEVVPEYAERLVRERISEVERAG